MISVQRDVVVKQMGEKPGIKEQAGENAGKL